MSVNASNFTNINTTFWRPEASPKIISGLVCCSFLIFLGTFLNVWFIAAILTSSKLRSLMRNKFIVNMAVVHLVECLVQTPVGMGLIGQYLNNIVITCGQLVVFFMVMLMLDFVANWILLILLAFLVANICDYDPTRTLSLRAVTMATAGVLVFPWIGSLITVPAIMMVHHNRSRFSWSTCILPTNESLKSLRSVDTAVPLLISLILASVACVLRRLRFGKGDSSDVMSRELTGREREIDSDLFYVIVVGVAIFCDFITVLFAFDAFKDVNWNIKSSLTLAAGILADSRVIFMPFSWLLLSDVRQRIRS